MRVYWFLIFGFLCSAVSPSMEAQQARGTLIVEVRSGSRPVEQAEVSAGGQEAVTGEGGEATLQLPAGESEVTVERYGFASQTVRTSVAEGATTRIAVELEAVAVQKEEITVTATRTDVRIEDEPLRVEVLDQEEVEEKALMTPGDIAMILSETSGIRVQNSAPALGAATVRVQGLRGRYTQLLADGLPLYGGQTGAIGLLQIPPLDLAQVELIKGVASALYGPSALGGVINLVSRRPKERERELLVNGTTRNGSDTAFWIAEPEKNHWGYTLLGGAHFQGKTDIDRDGWADLPGYQRGVLRPRFFWDNGAGSSLFSTVGVMVENRSGGTIGEATVPDGRHFPEELNTRRLDTGMVGRFVTGKKVVSIRGSFMEQRQRHQFGDTVERDRRETWFGEAAVSGTKGAHTWVIGSALQSDLYRARDLPGFNYTYTVPAVFAQDEYALASWVTLSGSGRLDVHSVYGAFLNPRISALLRMPGRVTARVSAGTGVFGPTPFTEETEAVGLSRLQQLKDLRAERARSVSGDLGWSSPHVELNGTVFGSIIRDPVLLRPSPTTAGRMEIVNAIGPTHTAGTELLARFHEGEFSVVLTHTFTRSTEIDRENRERRDVPLTPRHTVGAVVTWEQEKRGRLGVEAFYTGRQGLEDNPYRDTSPPYWLWGALAERRFGRVRLFVNAENLNNVRQTRYDPLLRPQQHFDGQWTVDEWAPLEGRVINGGVRVEF